MDPQTFSGSVELGSPGAYIPSSPFFVVPTWFGGSGSIGSQSVYNTSRRIHIPPKASRRVDAEENAGGSTAADSLWSLRKNGSGSVLVRDT